MISLNGQLMEAEKPCLWPSNRSFRYGDGLFETIRVENGRVLWSGLHLARLKKGAGLLKYKISHFLNLNDFEQNILKVYNANHPAGQSARVRVSLFRNEGGFYAPEDNSASFIVETSALANSYYPLNRKGKMLGLFEDYYKPCHALGNLKSANAIIYVLAGLYASEKKFDDCLIINDERLLAESISSNVFMVKGQQIITPSLDQACVEGVMRSVVLNIASSLGFSVEQRPVDPDELLKADEVFLTNAISGITWVSGFRHKRYFNKVAAYLSDALNKAAREG